MQSIIYATTKFGYCVQILDGGEVVHEYSAGTNSLERKGYKALKVPEGIARAGEVYKVRTPDQVIGEDDRLGREIVAATDDANAALQFIWDNIVLAGMTKEKARPLVKCFRSMMDGGIVCQGFYRDGVVYVNENLANGQSVELRQTLLEEAAHFITGSKDETRDFQDWAFMFATRLAMAKDECPTS